MAGTVLLVALLPSVGAGTVRPAGISLALSASPTSGPAPLTIDFRASVYPSTTTATFDWAFGDGATFDVTQPGLSTPTHAYSVPGSYDASVSVSSSAGDAAANLTVVVGSGNLTLSITATPTEGAAPLAVQFDAQLGGTAGASPPVLWDFGDGGGGTGPIVQYTYQRSGTYRVNATVEEAPDRSASASLTIVVADVPGGGDGAGATASPPALLIDASVALVGITLVAVGCRWAVSRSRPGNDPVSPNSGAPGSGVVGPPMPPTPPEAASVIGPEVAVAAVAPRTTAAPSTREDPVPRPPGADSPDEGRRLSERLMTHLLWYGRPTTERVARVEATQQGMARSLHVGQNSISKVLLRLQAAGVVRVETQHVPGAPRRVKTYTLTPQGEAIARAIERTSGRSGPRP
jgi:PKD repeat protein